MARGARLPGAWRAGCMGEGARGGVPVGEASALAQGRAWVSEAWVSEKGVEASQSARRAATHMATPTSISSQASKVAVTETLRMAGAASSRPAARM